MAMMMARFRFFSPTYSQRNDKPPNCADTEQPKNNRLFITDVYCRDIKNAVKIILERRSQTTRNKGRRNAPTEKTSENEG